MYLYLDKTNKCWSIFIRIYLFNICLMFVHFHWQGTEVFCKITARHSSFSDMRLCFLWYLKICNYSISHFTLNFNVKLSNFETDKLKTGSNFDTLTWMTVCFWYCWSWIFIYRNCGWGYFILNKFLYWQIGIVSVAQPNGEGLLFHCLLWHKCFSECVSFAGFITLHFVEFL